MPMVTKTATTPRRRILIRGLPNSGKTISLLTFMYGEYDYADDIQRADALTYAGNRQMVILSCPGETGTLSLPESNANITSIYFEAPADRETMTYEWSADALSDFSRAEKAVIANKPDILAYDGLTSLALQQFNVITDGDIFKGIDLDINPSTGRNQPYRKANFYDRLCNKFGQTMGAIYNQPVPMIVCTCWDDWKGSSSDEERAQGIEVKRYLWPDIPGKMATRVTGLLDATISARRDYLCFHTGCQDKAAKRDHYVWQFHDGGDVKGLGIKGLKLQRDMITHPFIHQNWTKLEVLLNLGRR
jgi:hypothetical protein